MEFDFLQKANIKKLFNLFDMNNEKLYIVGGGVRNAILKIPTDDIDFATTSTPEKTFKILKDNKISTNDIGINFGTVIAIIDGEKFDITTLREDTYTTSRYPKTKYIKDITKDYIRRDFTMNAIYLDGQGKLYDFGNGMQDIENKVVKFVKSPLTSIKEDPLRILRYFRFCSLYFYDNFDDTSLNVALNNFHLIKNINSNKKIKSELDKISSGDGANIILDIWEKAGILELTKKYMKD